jgi:hypothetical protein
VYSGGLRAPRVHGHTFYTDAASTCGTIDARRMVYVRLIIIMDVHRTARLDDFCRQRSEKDYAFGWFVPAETLAEQA